MVRGKEVSQRRWPLLQSDTARRGGSHTSSFLGHLLLFIGRFDRILCDISVLFTSLLCNGLLAVLGTMSFRIGAPLHDLAFVQGMALALERALARLVHNHG